MSYPQPSTSRRLAIAASLALPLLATPLWAATSGAAPGAATAVSPVDGGTLTYAVFQEPTSLVSFLDTKTDNRNVSAKITEGLLRYDAPVSYTHLTLPTKA